MERTLVYQIEKPTTVGAFLKEEAGLTRRQISALKFREKGILADGIRKRVSDRLEPGTELVLCLEEAEKGSHHLVGEKGEFFVLYEDPDILAVRKPAGILVHPTGGHFSDTLSNRAAAYYREKGEQAVIRPVGRLDKDTSGVVLFAKNQLSAARLSGEKEQGGFSKTYLAIVKGHLPEKRGEIHAPIGPCPGERLKMQVDPVQGKEAHTSYEVLGEFEDSSLLKVWIATGRTHQIRVHMAYLGHPLVGDGLYGRTSEEFERAALHAWELTCRQPFSGEGISVKDSIPADFQEYLRKRDYHGFDDTLLY